MNNEKISKERKQYIGKIKRKKAIVLITQILILLGLICVLYSIIKHKFMK